MRSGRWLLASLALVLFGASLALAAEVSSAVQEAAPWHISKVTKLNVARPGPAAAAEAGVQKYLAHRSPIQRSARRAEEGQVPRRQ